MTGHLRSIDYADPVVKYRGERLLYTLKRLGGRDIPVKEDVLVDIYYVHYLPFPLLKSKEESKEESDTLHNLFNKILSSEEIITNREYSVANSSVSNALSVGYAQNLIEELEKIKKSSPNEGERQAADYILQSLMKGGSPQSAVSQNEVERVMNQAHQKAMSKAIEDSHTVRDMQRIMGGMGAGTGSMLTFDGEIHEVMKLARNTEVKKILEFLSGIPHLGFPSKKKTTKFPRGELFGYEKGNDLERLVTSELALPDELFYLKLAESDLLLFEKRINETLGPIYLLLDKSGSMDGEKILWAKAVGLALYNKARRENRSFYLRFFDNIPYPLIKVMRNAKPKDVLKMVEYMSKVRGGGGTDISRSIISACEDIKEGHVKGVGEVVLLTDGEDKIAEAAVRKSVKEANSSLISVMIRGDNPDLRRVSDKYLVVYKLDQEDLLRVVEA
ncbi:hypothetical protein HS7_18260 [Sulfolobales archaeon HS-7]|nr:hypothetical protein HS7_18260 [Sulfolobales archaeon HS-7]